MNPRAGVVGHMDTSATEEQGADDRGALSDQDLLQACRQYDNWHQRRRIDAEFEACLRSAEICVRAAAASVTWADHQEQWAQWLTGLSRAAHMGEGLPSVAGQRVLAYVYQTSAPVPPTGLPGVPLDFADLNRKTLPGQTAGSAPGQMAAP